jgi:hypothetical protein
MMVVPNTSSTTISVSTIALAFSPPRSYSRGRAP